MVSSPSHEEQPYEQDHQMLDPEFASKHDKKGRRKTLIRSSRERVLSTVLTGAVAPIRSTSRSTSNNSFSPRLEAVASPINSQLRGFRRVSSSSEICRFSFFFSSPSSSSLSSSSSSVSMDKSCYVQSPMGCMRSTSSLLSSPASSLANCSSS